MTNEHRAERWRQWLRDAAVTLAAVVLAFAAFDDITTDRAATFTVEWVGLAMCAAWLFALSWRLVRSEHRRLGFISLIALVVVVGAGSTIRAGIDPFRAEYLTTMAGLLWFLALAGILAGQAWRLRAAGRA
jgi:hypothetical protein